MTSALAFSLLAGLLLGAPARGEDGEAEFKEMPGASAPATSGRPAPGASSFSAEAPDESWEGFPAGTRPSPSKTPPPSLRVHTTPPPMVSETAAPVRLAGTEAPVLNSVSLYGAPALGRFERAFGVYVGFPLLGVRVAMGLTDRLDVGVGFDSFYTAMNEVRLLGRYQFWGTEHWAASLVFEAGKAYFNAKPVVEGTGARWLTGRRNYNFVPGAVLSYRGGSPHSARLFFDLRYHGAVDSEPYQKDPLGGVPASLQLGHNLPIRLGAEMPLSARTSFVFVLGFDLHGRAEDSAFMPFVSVGLVSGI